MILDFDRKKRLLKRKRKKRRKKRNRKRRSQDCGKKILKVFMTPNHGVGYITCARLLREIIFALLLYTS